MKRWPNGCQPSHRVRALHSRKRDKQLWLCDPSHVRSMQIRLGYSHVCCSYTHILSHFFALILLTASTGVEDGNGSAEGGTEGGGLVVGGAAAIRGRPIKEGMLAKRGHVRKNWQNRHFVITPGFITYFDQPGGQVKGTVRLSESTAVSIVDSGDEDVDRSYQFEVKCDGRDLLMESKSESDMAEWMDAIALAANGAEPEPQEEA